MFSPRAAVFFDRMPLPHAKEKKLPGIFFPEAFLTLKQVGWLAQLSGVILGVQDGDAALNLGIDSAGRLDILGDDGAIVAVGAVDQLTAGQLLHRSFGTAAGGVSGIKHVKHGVAVPATGHKVVGSQGVAGF